VTVGIRILLVLALLVGLVWLGQGAGLIGGSFMSGDPLWAVIGGIVSAVAALGLWASTRTRRA
jgi:hypothetical protein